MCARYYLRERLLDLSKIFACSLELEDSLWEPNFNIAPTNQAPVIVDNLTSNQRMLQVFRWGLIPFWHKEPAKAKPLVNARAETAHEKPSFRSPFARKRCLVPVSGYLEWRTEEGKKQPYAFHLDGERNFALAGLYDCNQKTGEAVFSFSILTTEPNEFASQYHNRMPVILEDSDFDQWLDPDYHNTEELRKLCKSAPETLLKTKPVDPRINSVRANGEELLKHYLVTSQPGLSKIKSAN